jgi:hypothetical protein
VLASAAVVVAVGLVLVVQRGGGDDRLDAGKSVEPATGLRGSRVLTQAATSSSTTTSTSTTVAPTTTTTAPPPTTTTLPPPRFTLDPYHGLGAWLDVFDWSVTYNTEGPPEVDLDDIDRMASLGVRTLYFQAARWDGPRGVLEPDRAMAFIDRAHADGMAVVGWYLPTFEDLLADRAQIDAVAQLPIEGLGIDIESTRVADEADRDQRLVELSADLRATYPGEVLSAIVLPPVVTNVFGTYWHTFPWAQLAPYYDVWQPMGYWTNRTVESGWRDAYAYTAANIDILRQELGNPNAVVHPVGGIGCCEGIGVPSTPEDIDGMVRAAADRGAPGASLYDYVTTGDDLWGPLQAANGLG